jgi:ATP-dependent DNA helicase RecQ
VPYSKHVNQLLSKVNTDGNTIASGYYGGMPSDQKKHAFRSFKSNETKIMISTKAFGMGVDIPDVEVVYHHAPSGLLPDYVQEVGRLARKPSIQGFAALNYSAKDQRFSKALHGMSALKQHQLRLVLQKIYKAYRDRKRQNNILVSAEDFGHIF